MVVDFALFFFVLLGSKILLGVIAVWMLIPRDATCTVCDAETLPLEHRRGTVFLLRMCRLQRRWCMECRRESLSRRIIAPAASRRDAPLPIAEHRAP